MERRQLSAIEKAAKYKDQLFPLTLIDTCSEKSVLAGAKVAGHRQIEYLHLPKSPHMSNNLTRDEFMNVEMRVGTILSAEIFKEVRNPAYKITIDFGEFGIRKTSAQLPYYMLPKN